MTRLSLSSQTHSHGVSVSDVFAGGLDDGLAGLVQGPINAIVGPGVRFLNQRLELRDTHTQSYENHSSAAALFNTNESLTTLFLI